MLAPVVAPGTFPVETPGIVVPGWTIPGDEGGCPTPLPEDVGMPRGLTTGKPVTGSIEITASCVAVAVGLAVKVGVTVDVGVGGMASTVAVGSNVGVAVCVGVGLSSVPGGGARSRQAEAKSVSALNSIAALRL